jgi:DNA repair exonuclease SbcCD nuclease subunit
MADRTIHLAIFGDTHGHLRLMFQLCRLWQMHHGIILDAILQCGDLGYFPDPDRLDKATKRYVRKDREELGFRYLDPGPDGERDTRLEAMLLGPTGELAWGTVRCPVFFCHGNHEDFQSLSELDGRGACSTVDRYGRIHWIRPGHVAVVAGLHVAALGGGVEPEPGKEDPDAHTLKTVDPGAVERLISEHLDLMLTHNEHFDILLTHVAP